MKSKYTKTKSCRICGNKNLASVLNLGDQALTGVFPKNKKEKITHGPLELLKCQERKDNSSCGLVQLAHSYSKHEMYGENYGYRSGLNKLMTDHLENKAEKIKKMVSLKSGDVVVDIGSNDASFLKNFTEDLILVGIDPTGIKFKEHYPKHITLIPDFFSADIFKKNFPGKKAKVVTSIAMFYDLDVPMDFVRNIGEILDDEGVWVTEQSYLPFMLKANSYDTICHEHLEYYCLKQIKWMADMAGLKIIDVEFNDVNGGSFSIVMAKKASSFKENKKVISKILKLEKKNGMSSNKPIKSFHARLVKSRDDILQFLIKTKCEKKTVMGYGASTKGNVLLQFCGITEAIMPFVGEVNPHKFGCFTPGTHIPIISEQEVKKKRPDYLLVLPWHFRKAIIAKEQEYLESGGTLVFPLPKLELINAKKGKIRR